MLKRSATTDLNHTNWDAEEEEEQERPTDFKRASAEVMSKRIIKTGKRRLGAKAPDVSDSPFSGFAFGGASNNSSNSSATAPSFNFMSAPKSQATTVDGKTVESKPNEQNDKKDSAARETFLAKLKGLNEEFISWINGHFKRNPTCIFTPVFEDYEKYLKEIKVERDTKKNPTPSTASPFSGIKFSADIPSKSTAGSSFLGSTNTTAAPASAPASSDKSGKLASEKPQGGSIFGNTPFGSAPKTGVVPFSFGGAEPFKFGNVQSPFDSTSPLRSTAPAEVLNEEEEEETPKNEFIPVTEDDAVFSQRVKVFAKKEADYADRGVGMLYIKPAKNKYQAVVRADTSLGNLLLNIILSESMPIKRMGKNNVMLVCVPLPGNDAKPLPMLLKVKTKEEADKLFDELNKYKK